MNPVTRIDDRSTSAPAELLRVTGLRVANGGSTLVEDIDLVVHEGESVAIVGESGSGKSLTARAIIGLLPEGLVAQGSIRYRQEELLDAGPAARKRVRGSEICLILQDPFTMLHPLIRCGDIVTENLRGSSGKRPTAPERRDEAIRRLAEVGIDDPRVVDRYPFELSGGMRQRVAIAAALAQDPTLLIADEPSTALDATTQKEVLDLLASLQKSRGMALILITHDLRIAFSVCQRVNVFYAGNVLESGPTALVAAAPAHPYTLGLLLAEPPIDRRVREFVSIPGSVPTPDSVVGQCAFADRCAWATEICREDRPRLNLLDGGRSTACRRVDEIADDLAGRRSTFQQSAVAIPRRSDGPLLLEATDLTVTFGKASTATAVLALDRVSIDIRSGESVGVVGESGSGKTTLSRVIAGLAEPTSGSLSIDGLDASSYGRIGRAARARLRKRVQMIFQDPYSSLDPTHTIGYTLSEAIRFRTGTRVGGDEVGALLSRVGLPRSYGARLPVALSGGERQRIGIARAIAVEPQLLILDEPVSALDVSVQAQILTLLREIHDESGIAYLFITHDLAVVRQIADRIFVMNRGRVVESGPTDIVLDSPRDPYTRLLVNADPERIESAAVASA